MKRKDTMHCLARSLLAALLATFAALSLAAEPSTTEKISSYAHDRKAEAVAEGKRLIAEADKKIAEMKQQAKQSGTDTKTAYEANMKELVQKKKEAQAQLAKMQKASSKTWEATKEGFANAYSAMRASFDKATSDAK